MIDQFDANGSSLAWGAKWGEPDNPFPSSTPVGFFDGSLQLRSEWNWPADWNCVNPYPGFDANSFQTRDNANAFGIYDLSGNVWELMQDKYSPFSVDRVIRGGGLASNWFDLVTDYRIGTAPWVSSPLTGFRVVTTPDPCSGLLALDAVFFLGFSRRP